MLLCFLDSNVTAVTPLALGQREVFRLSVEKGLAMKYPRLDLGQIEAIVNKMGGMDEVQAFLAGVTTLKSALTPRTFIPWLPLRVGGRPDPEKHYTKCLSDREVLYGTDAVELVQRIKWVKHQTDLRLVRIRPRDLGIKAHVKYRIFCGCAEEMGLIKCPAEAGPAMRIQYFNTQPKGELLRIAMQPMRSPVLGMGPEIFMLQREESGAFYLETASADEVDLDDEYVFALLK